MKTKILAFVLAVACYTVASAQTVDEIVAKYVKASGGAEKMRAVKSIITKNTIAVQGLELQNTATVVVNKYLRAESDVMGSQTIQAFDGNKAWQLIPAAMGGTNEAQEMPASATKTIKAQLDPFPLLDYATKKTKLEYLGTEQLNGQPSWHLKMTTKDTVESELWIDSNTGFLRKQRNNQDGMTTDILFSKEREQDGIYFATYMDISNAMVNNAIMETKTITLNPAIDPAIFQFPTKK
jgi:hypothetical protein